MPFSVCRSLALVALLLVATGCPPGSSPAASDDAGCSGESCATTTDLAGSIGAGDDLGSATSCEGVTCNTPPARVCADAQTLRIYDSTGSCSDGKCSYAAHTESC